MTAPHPTAPARSAPARTAPRRLGLPADTPAADLARWPVVNVTPDTTLSRAVELFDEHELHHLPVVDADKRPVGMLSVRDIDRVTSWKPLYLPGYNGMSARRELERLTVGSVMTAPCVTLPETATVTDAAALIHGRRLHCIPLVDGDGVVAGVITAHDLLGAAYPIPRTGS